MHFIEWKKPSVVIRQDEYLPKRQVTNAEPPNPLRDVSLLSNCKRHILGIIAHLPF